MLPLDIQMQIDLSAQAHHREIAESFAKVRDELLAPIVYFSHEKWPPFLTVHTMGDNAVIEFKDCHVLGPVNPFTFLCSAPGGVSFAQPRA